MIRLVKISVVSVKTGNGRNLERYNICPENFHRNEPFYLNSPRNFRVFDTNGKHSKSSNTEDKVKTTRRVKKQQQ